MTPPPSPPSKSTIILTFPLHIKWSNRLQEIYVENNFRMLFLLFALNTMFFSRSFSHAYYIIIRSIFFGYSRTPLSANSTQQWGLWGLFTNISFFPTPFCQFPHVAFNLLSLAMYSLPLGLLHPSCPYMLTRCRSKCRGGSCRRTVRWKGDRCVIDVCVRQTTHHRRITPEVEHNNSKLLRC